MARTKAGLSVGVRLSDLLSASLLARVYPAELIDEILLAHDVQSKRQRSLPARTMSYYCIALSLYPECAYEAVYDVLAEGLHWAQGERSTPNMRGTHSASHFGVSKSAISAARSKLGAAPLKTLFEQACAPLADPRIQPEAFYAGLRLVAIDGTHFELADEADNVKIFGRPGSRTGVAAYPQAQCIALVECATHALIGAEIGTYRQSEWTLCKPLLTKLDASMLCLADRGFGGFEQWQKARASGAHLLWRAKQNRQLPVLKSLPDGSYLSEIYPSFDAAGRLIRQGKQGAQRTDGIAVRVIEYTLPESALGANERANKTGHKRAATVDRYRLISSLLDPKVASALDLARIYHERWEVEGAFDELKTHLISARRCLRSKTAEGVKKEFYGWVLAHYAVCWLMHRAASAQRVRLRSLSFTGSLRLLRLTQPHSGAFPPSETKTASQAFPNDSRSRRRTKMRQ